jgi:glycosyltransferase involved in cell wall biosynthesis
MRIGVFLESSPETGGGFQQALSTTEFLARKGVTKHDIVVFTSSPKTAQHLLKYGISSVRFRGGIFRLLDTWSGTVAGNAILRRLSRLGLGRLGRHLDALLDAHGIDLVLLNECTGAVLRIGDHPFIVTIWDLDHRDHPELPESYLDRAFERRERTLGKTLPRALGVISNSAYLTKRIANLYRVDSHRIIELPFLPSLGVRQHVTGTNSTSLDTVRRKYELPEHYIFYPAYFLPQKNHLYILEGLVELARRHDIVLHAVFSGGDSPHRRIVERQVEALHLKEKVRFLGAVPDDEIPSLYEGAVALVMPTYCGPTNLPPLEAVTLGCPVIYSDLPGCREQMGDAALYCDLTNVSSLVEHLKTLIQDPRELQRLAQAGKKLAADIAAIDYAKRLEPLLDSYAYTRRRWAWPQGNR